MSGSFIVEHHLQGWSNPREVREKEMTTRTTSERVSWCIKSDKAGDIGLTAKSKMWLKGGVGATKFDHYKANVTVLHYQKSVMKRLRAEGRH